MSRKQRASRAASSTRKRVSRDVASCPTGLLRPVAAHGQDAAALATRGIAAGRAALEHAHVAEREVVLDGVARVEAGEFLRDFGRCLPRNVTPIGEAEVTAELVNVSVDGDDESARRNGPEAEIDAVFGARHPAQEKEKAFCGRALRRVGEDVGGASALAFGVEATFAADGGSPYDEGLPEIAFLGERCGEGFSERAFAALDASRAGEEARDVLA